MKKQHTNKKTESLLHIQEIAHSRNKPSKLILRILVWILILAFVTTLGVTWGGAGAAAYGNIVSTKKLKVDLAPSSFFLREREAAQAQLVENNPEADPRLITTLSSTSALRRTEALALRYNFIEDIQLKPSAEVADMIRRNPATANPAAINYYYGAQSLLAQLGVYFILSEPSTSDIYAVNDIGRMRIAAEGIAFSATNFYGAQIPLAEKQAYYNSRLTNWADRIVAAEFTTDSRSNALEISKALSSSKTFDEGVKAVTALFQTKDARWGKSGYTPQNIILPKPQTYDLFSAGAEAFQKKAPDSEAAVSAPVYTKTGYTVLYVISAGSYDALNPVIQQMILNAMVSSRYKELTKTHKTAYEQALDALKKEGAAGTSFSEIATKVPGARYDVSQAFSPLMNAATSVSGAEFASPVLSDPRLLKILLAPPATAAEVFASKNEKDTYYLVRPITVSAPKPEELLVNLQAEMTNIQNLQNIFAYRSTMLDYSLTTGLKKRYDLKSNPELLTNFK